VTEWLLGAILLVELGQLIVSIYNGRHAKKSKPVHGPVR